MIANWWHDKALRLAQQGKMEGAAICFDRAVKLAPERAAMRGNYANCLRRLWRYEEAWREALVASKLEPDNLDIRAIVGCLHMDENKPDAAVDRLQTAKAAGDYQAFCHAVSLLHAGRWGEGFRAYDARLANAERVYPITIWQGESLVGKTVAVHHEQGFGDTIMFSRFLDLLPGNYLFGVPGPLLRLFPKAVSINTQLMADYQLPLMSIPARVGLDTLPEKKPYIKPPILFSLERPAMTKLAVGLVWQSKAGGTPDFDIRLHGIRKSIPLDLLLPLATIPGVALYGLQVGDAADDIERLGAGDFIQNLAPRMIDFADLAGFIEQLDLIVSVDTAPLHLAGAMGKPAIGLLNYVGSWQWLTGDKTPWYPSIDIIRQPKPFDWQTVSEKLVEEVTRRAGGKPAVSLPYQAQLRGHPGT